MKTPNFSAGNKTAAAIILETPEVYGVAMVAWARRVLPTLPERAEQDALDMPPDACEESRC